MDNNQNKKIARNTLYLYVRMIVMLFVSLFTSRITLNVIGVHDYGVYNVVGGILGIFSYASTLLYQGTSRFLTISLGKEDFDELKNVFSACLNLHIVIAILLVVIGETFGVWFLNTQLVIDANRMLAANFVYQFSLFGAVVAIIQSPFTATVISHEKMSAFAFLAIFDVAMKLLLVCLLLFINFDKLILYGGFYFIVSLIVFSLYFFFCRRHFNECNFSLKWDGALYKKIWNYVGWNAIGSFAFTCNTQGVTVLLNMFFSTIVNAARGITTTVSYNIQNFVTNFQTAARPQIVKLYAQGKLDEMNVLIMNTSKYSSFLLMIFIVPFSLETQYIIELWLGQVPEFVVPFIRLTFIEMFFRSIDFPLGAGLHAVGRMKIPNLTSSIVYLSVLPISYLALKFGATPIISYVVSIFVYPIAMICDLFIINKYTQFQVGVFLKNVLCRSVFVYTVGGILPLYIHCSMDYGGRRFLLVGFISLLSSILVVFYIGLNQMMRKKIINFLIFKLNKITHG